MSQQINLLLPELRPRFDWLALPVVVGVALAVLLGIVVVAEAESLRLARLSVRESELHGQLLAAQQQVQQLGKMLGERHENLALRQQITAARLQNGERREVLEFVRSGQAGDASGFSGMLQGFSRQVTEGVWLVGFTLAQNDVAITGRLVDPAQLPVYINHLNGDPAFVGRHFAALEMKGVDPATAANGQKTAAAPGQAQPASLPPYTEFALRTNRDKVTEKAP